MKNMKYGKLFINIVFILNRYKVLAALKSYFNNSTTTLNTHTYITNINTCTQTSIRNDDRLMFALTLVTSTEVPISLILLFLSWFLQEM